MEWNHEKNLILINLYQENELLWNPKHPEHKSRPKRFHALNNLAKHFDTDVTEIERKIKNLTSQYYREKKKVTDSEKSGTDTIYKSKWFGYKSFSFLETKKPSSATIDTEATDASNDAAPEQIDSSYAQQNNSPPISAAKTIKRVRRNPKREIVSKALNLIKSAQQQSETTQKDENTLFGEYIAAKLRNMDKSTNAIVRHRINNIIFETEIADTDYARPSSSSNSHLGYYTGSPNDHPDAHLSNPSSSIYSAVASPDNEFSSITDIDIKPNIKILSQCSITPSSLPLSPEAKFSVTLPIDETSNSERKCE